MYLNESKIDYILQNQEIISRIAKKYLSDNKLDSSNFDSLYDIAFTVLKQCEQLPYTNKYMVWLIKQYVKDKFKIPEDLSKLNSELKNFNRISHKLDKTDISDYSWEDFLSIIPKMDNTLTSNEEKRLAKAGAEKLFEDENWIIIHPKTREASCYYGKGTRWCTASTETRNYFDSYNSEGNLYILINKQDPNKKYQLHVETNSFSDALDNRISISDVNFFFNDEKLIKFLEPKLNKYFSFKLELNESVNGTFEYSSFVLPMTYELIHSIMTDKLSSQIKNAYHFMEDEYFTESLNNLLKSYGINDDYNKSKTLRTIISGTVYDTDIYSKYKDILQITNVEESKKKLLEILNKIYENNIELKIKYVVDSNEIIFNSKITKELYQEYRKYNLFGKLLYAVEIPYNSYDPYDFISYYYVLKYTNGKNKYLYIDGSIINIEPNQEKLKKLTNEFLNELIKELTVNNINIIYKELAKHKDD